MKKLSALVVLVAIMLAAFYALNTYIYNEKQGDDTASMVEEKPLHSDYSITPISHASLVITWGDTTFYLDPVGDASLYDDAPSPDIILITDIHGDHFNLDTITSVMTPQTIFIVPQVVRDEMPESLSEQITTLANDTTTELRGFIIAALAMYNVPESDDAFHVKGRGNGYVIDKGGKRIYIAGDTSNTPEMQALLNIDSAFIPMNLPFTMTVEEAAQATLGLKPKYVYPYHYRGRDGFSDVQKFKELVNAGNANIEVVLLDWYPENE